MKGIIAGIVLATTLASAVPATAQRIDIGPDGPSIDMRSRGERARDNRREEYRGDRDDRRMSRQQRDDDDDRGGRGERRGSRY